MRVVDNVGMAMMRRATMRAAEELRAEEAAFVDEVAIEAAPPRPAEQRGNQAAGSAVVAEALSRMAGIVQAGARERSWLADRVDAQQETLRVMRQELTQGMGRIAEDVHQEVADIAFGMRGCRAEIQGLLEQMHARLGSIAGADGHPPVAIMAEER